MAPPTFVGVERDRPVAVGEPPGARRAHAHLALAEEAHFEACSPARPAANPGDPARLKQVAQWLAEADHPLLFAGGGVVQGDAAPAFREVAHLLQAPVVTTREGKGAIPDDDPLSVGTAWVNRRLHPLIQSADLILAIGTRFQNSGAQPSQRVVHIDVDATELGKNFPGAYGVEADARLALETLREELDGLAPRPSRAQACREARREIEASLRAVGPQAAIVETLRAALPRETLVVAGTTTVGYMCHMHFPVYEARSYISSSYMGTLGFAFPTALGAQVARPDRPVVAISGDGGFLFAASELATAVQYQIPVICVVFNDGAYGNSNRDQRERFEGREIGTQLHNPDFARLAQSFGADGVRLSGSEQLSAALSEALAGGRPSVIECPIPRLPSPF